MSPMDIISVSVPFYFKPIQFSIWINIFSLFFSPQSNMAVRVIFPNDSHLDLQFFQHHSILVFKTISILLQNSYIWTSRYTIFENSNIKDPFQIRWGKLVEHVSAAKVVGLLLDNVPDKLRTSESSIRN